MCLEFSENRGGAGDGPEGLAGGGHRGARKDDQAPVEKAKATRRVQMNCNIYGALSLCQILLSYIYYLF